MDNCDNCEQAIPEMSDCGGHGINVRLTFKRRIEEEIARQSEMLARLQELKKLLDEVPQAERMFELAGL